MNYTFFILCLVLFTHAVHSQENLILNGNFEEYWECPDFYAQIERCKYVYNPCLAPNWEPPQFSTTSDYFHSCSSNNFIQTPNAGFGYRTPRSGEAYIGAIHSNSYGNYKEYFQLSFSQELTAFATYRFSIYASVSGVNGWSTNFFHFKFTDSIRYYDNLLSEYLIPDVILSDLNLVDSNTWVEISFDYLAQGGEKYIIIGNFNSELNDNCFFAFQGSDSLVSNPSQGQAYFYFDDAELILLKEAEAISFPNVITPNDDGVNDQFVLLSGQEHAETIVIFNRWGNVVYESSTCFIWDGNNLQGIPLNDGVYFVKVTSKIKKDNKNQIYQGIVHLIR